MAGVPPPRPSGQQQQHVAPLQPGWTEHIGPQGQLYWYNAPLNQSTYYRPSAVATTAGTFNATPSSGNKIPLYTGPPPGFASGSTLVVDRSDAPPKEPSSVRKEKPAKKEPIPGAEGWLRVTSTLGNVFYAHTVSKRSEWTVPEEIREHVEEIQAEERRAKREQERLEKEEREQVERARRKEQERKDEDSRLKIEQQRRQREEEKQRKEEVLRKMQEERARVQQDRLRILEEATKRKRGAQAEQNGGLGPNFEGGKRARLNEKQDEDEGEDEETWQRRMAEQMAAEADAEAISVEKPQESRSESMEPGTIYANQDLTNEQGKEVFLHMLTSLNGSANEVNPMMPWDRELPKFVSLRDYTVLPALRDRQDAFNEWCRLRLREKREAAAAAKSSAYTTNLPHSGPALSEGTSANGKQLSAAVDDSAASYQELLEGEVRSTRTKWDDFRKEWKRDRRFFAFGRDDREREKQFRKWLKTLGERKRQVAERADTAFVTLLAEYLTDEYRLAEHATTDEAHKTWTRGKKVPGLDRDPRYDAVGSSSRRAELFEEWAKGKRNRADREQRRPDDVGLAQPDHQHPAAVRDEQSALRSREERVRREQRQLAAEKNRSFGHAVHEESTTQFQQLLLDAVRDPLARLDDTFASLERDNRFRAPGLDDREKEDLFYEHIEKLNERRLRSLEEVFARHAPTLDVDAEHAVPLIKDDEEVARKELDQLHSIVRRGKTITNLFESWQARREKDAKDAFVQMLRENAFVEFWGRLRQEYDQKNCATNEHSDGVHGMVGHNGDDEDADVPSLLQMAAQIDLNEVHAILQHDQRYRAFEHEPQQRQQWIRDYLQTMAIPKKTVFQKA